MRQCFCFPHPFINLKLCPSCRVLQQARVGNLFRLKFKILNYPGDLVDAAMVLLAEEARDRGRAPLLERHSCIGLYLEDTRKQRLYPNRRLTFFILERVHKNIWRCRHRSTSRAKYRQAISIARQRAFGLQKTIARARLKDQVPPVPSKPPPTRTITPLTIKRFLQAY